VSRRPRYNPRRSTRRPRLVDGSTTVIATLISVDHRGKLYQTDALWCSREGRRAWAEESCLWLTPLADRPGARQSLLSNQKSGQAADFAEGPTFPPHSRPDGMLQHCRKPWSVQPAESIPCIIGELVTEGLRRALGRGSRLAAIPSRPSAATGRRQAPPDNTVRTRLTP
jgi:hypothetical protein